MLNKKGRRLSNRRGNSAYCYMHKKIVEVKNAAFYI